MSVLATVLIRSTKFLMLEWHSNNTLTKGARGGMPRSTEFQGFRMHVHFDTRGLCRHARRHTHAHAHIHTCINCIRYIDRYAETRRTMLHRPKHSRCMLLFDSGVCEKRFPFVLQAARGFSCPSPLSSMLKDGGASTPTQNGNLFSRAANHPCLDTTNIEVKGEGL